MTIIAEFRVRSPELALSSTLEAVSGIDLDLVQEAGTSDRPYLIFWVAADDLEEFDRRLRQDGSVTDIEHYTTVDDRRLYRARITEAVEVVSYPMWVELGAEQIDARYVEGWWYNRMRLPDRDALTTIEEWCLEHDVEFDLQAVYTDYGGRSSRESLTTQQREVLRIALETGYFDVPRSGTLADIADELDISSQAVSERLRRGHRQLVERHLGPSATGNDSWPSSK